MSDQETYLAVLKASYDYEPQPDASDELAIKEGQILLLLERTDEDWWKVKLKPESQEEDGSVGMIPKAYVDEAEHISVVKALYDYEATQSTELTIKEEELLYVYDKDDSWLLVRKTSDDTQVGYVPGNYVEEVNGEEASSTLAAAPPVLSQIVIPPSPSRPVSTYVDPADLVATVPTKAQADDIQTWAISEVDKKGKKKKGTLGVGNGAVFFASESDKTPVQKWQTADIRDVRLEKSKHVHIDIGGAEPIGLHFHAGSKDIAEAILAKLKSSRALSTPGTAGPSAVAVGETTEPESPPLARRSSPQKAVRFDAAEPAIIPPREPSDDGDEEEQPPGELGVVLYDFIADGEDELSVVEGESLYVLERDSDDWWKCRNSSGGEGVVPAQYVELVNRETSASAAVTEDKDAAAARETSERAEAERQEKQREQAERERAESQRKKEAEQRANAAAAAAEVDRKRREQERTKQQENARAAAAAPSSDSRKKKGQEEVERPSSDSQRKKTNGDSPGSSRNSIERRGPPPENTRVWHDRTGQFRVEAAFLGFKNGKLRLHKINGVVIEVPAEKMSADDLQYIEKLAKKSDSSRKADDDDEPLELRRRSLQPEAMRTPSSKTKKPTVDWFDFFLNAGCDVDDCTRYASSFERDKIDEAILPDITESTMRTLGLREGDIIRVKKAIDQRQLKKQSSPDVTQEQIRRDEELARQLQAEESGSNSGKTRSQPPNLFAAGPNGALKNNSMRRGRPQPSKSTPPSNVVLQSITTASDRIQRTDSPQVGSPETTTAVAPPAPAPSVQPPSRSSSAAPVVGGFDDDAWTNRPSSTKPTAPTPPAVAPRAPSAPPAPSAPLLPPVASAAPASTTSRQATGTTLAKTDNDIFEQLARLSQLRTTQSPTVQGPAIQTPQRAPSVPIFSPVSYQSGLGMGSSPAPMGQHLQNQQTGMVPSLQTAQLTNGPRGPLAPVPANQTLLQPLIPTTTGFNSFVPTRPQSAQPPFQTLPQSVQSPFQTPPQSARSPFQTPPPLPSFLPPQPTGFSGVSQSFLPQNTGFSGSAPMLPQPTGFVGNNFPSSGPLMSQPTGMPNGNFGAPTGGSFGSTPSFQTSGFGQIQSNATGYNPGIGSMPPFNNGISSPPPAPPTQSTVANTTPANVFAQMKSGTFAQDNSASPQSADTYNALRVNPSPLTVQPTGWGFQAMNGSGTLGGGYGFQR